jgi:hypothetical protein
VYGNIGGFDPYTIPIQAVKYHAGGCDNGVCADPMIGDVDFPFVSVVTPTGYVLGYGVIPGTIGSSSALWGPGGQFISFVGAASIRDRLDGNGVNLGGDLSSIARLGDTDITILDEMDEVWYDTSVIVSHSNFMVTQTFDYQSSTYTNFRGFFPGINPDFPSRAVPLLDIFPQLAAIDIDAITSAASVDGYLYLAINGSDGLYLFGAPDPSLVPEPAALMLVMMLAVPLAFKRF